MSSPEPSTVEAAEVAVWLPCWLLFVARVATTVVGRRAFDACETLVLLAAIGVTVHLARTVARWRAARSRERASRDAHRGVYR